MEVPCAVAPLASAESMTATPTFVPFGKGNRKGGRGGNACSDCGDERPFVLAVPLSHEDLWFCGRQRCIGSRDLPASPSAKEKKGSALWHMANQPTNTTSTQVSITLRASRNGVVDDAKQIYRDDGRGPDI